MWIDVWPKEKVKIFVPGSNTALLSSEFSSVLTGRHLEAGVWPLSFKEFYYFSEIKEVDFIVKEGLEVTTAINVCYDLSDRETYLRELSGLHEALNYFGLREALLITAEAQPEEITDRGLKIKIRPFYQWALEGSNALDTPVIHPAGAGLSSPA